MFCIDNALENAIQEKISNSSVSLDDANVRHMSDCSCQGSCGTYKTPCASCGYQT